MGKTVILSERRGIFKQWAHQFVRAQTDDDRRAIVVAGNIREDASHGAVMRFINTYYSRAAELAENGSLVISLAHGGANETDSTVGMVDLLPNQTLRLQREQARYPGSEIEEGHITVLSRAPNARVCRQQLRRYDLNENTRRPSPPSASTYMDCLGARGAGPQQRFQEAYARIGELLTEHHVNEVIFLTCRVGNATVFLDRIGAFWQTRVAAYRLRVAGNRDDNSDNSDNPYYIYLVGEESRKYRDQIPSRQMYRSS